MKTKMMRRISHEFRTPLSIILTASETLVYYMDRLTPEKRKFYIELIPRTIQDITSMLDDIAFMVKDKLTSKDFAFSMVNLEMLCQQVVNKLETSIAYSHIFILNTTEHLAFLMADESLLSYALHNLLLNATKYSPQGSKIWINFGIQNGEVLLQIRD
jgi:signal transduction histidine kinase